MSQPIRRAAALLLCGAAMLAATAQPRAATDVTITVTLGTAPVEGAFVAISGGDTERFAGLTGAAGTVTFTGLADATWRVAASAPGTTVGSGTLTTPGASTLSVEVTSSGSVFSGLGAFGSQTGTIRSGGRPGVFYLNTSAIPSLYRTADYGGSWAPVTISSDDPANGIDGSSRVDQLTTSGFPGEVAALAGGRLWYSRDFGVTWSSAVTPTGFGGGRQTVFVWGHPTAPGAPSVLLLSYEDPSNTMYFALMPTSSSSPAPSFSPMPGSYRASSTAPIAMGNGSDAPIVAVGDMTAGELKLYRVDTTPSPLDSSVTVAGIIPTTATDGSPLTAAHQHLITLGGPATGLTVGSAAAPNTILVYSNNNDTTAGAVVSSCNATSCTPTAATEFRNESDTVSSGTFLRGAPGYTSCAATREAGAISSISPQGVNGTIGGCWITLNGTTLTVRGVSGINNNTGMAFDTGYGTGGNAVLISGDGSKGAAKSARAGADQFEGLNRPYFPQWPVLASAGAGPETGGVAINGVNSAVVTDIAFNPASASELAVVMSFTGGGRAVGSLDGGATWFTLSSRGGNSIDWWQAPDSAAWILAGVGAGGDMLAAAPITSTAPFGQSTQFVQLMNTTGGQLGLSTTITMGQVVAAVEGLTGTDLAVVAAARTDMGGYAEGALSVVTLGPGPNAAVTLLSGGAFTSAAPVSLAYCPTSGSAASVADKVFVAVAAGTEGGTNGGLRVIDDASLSTRTVRTLTGDNTTGDFKVVRVHCASGTVWAGRYGSTGGGDPANALPGLVKSTNGGVSFAAITPAGRAGQILQRVRTLTIDERAASTVIVVSSSTDVVETRDGGFKWNILNDSSTAACPEGAEEPCGRTFGGEPGAVETPPKESGSTSSSGGGSVTLALRASSRITSDQAVLGSAAGLFTATTSSLNAATLNFSIVPFGTGQKLTDPQRVSITFTGDGTVNWTAVADETWIEITPSSGTGTGSFVVGLDGSQQPPPPGTYTATVTVTTTGALLSTQRIEVVLTVHSAGTTGLPFGLIDTPVDGITGVTGSLPITGWVLDDVGVNRVLIYRDPVEGEGSAPMFIGTAVLVAGSRPDVETLYPDHPQAYRAGWGYLLLTNMLPGQGNGTYRLHAYGEDEEGSLALLGSRTIVANNSTATKPFGAIDTPGQGETVSGTSYINFGWALTPQPNTIPTNGSTITVYVDGVPLGNPTYNLPRTDIAALFPGYANTAGAIGYRMLDTTALANGVHTIAWVVYDDGGRGEGIGSRYFTVQNGAGGSLVAANTSRVVSAEASSVERPALAELIGLRLRDTVLAATVGYGDVPSNGVWLGRDGIYAVNGREITRLEIRLENGDTASIGASFKGYSLVAGEVRPLPVGARLDERTGVFSWEPGVGFVGRYELLFVRETPGSRERMPVTVTLRPFGVR